MNKLNIHLSTYCEIEKKLGILTDDGLNRLLDQLQEIADFRQESGMIDHEGLINIIKLIKTLEIERDNYWGNTITIDDYAEINEKIFDNKSNKEEIKVWLLKDMLMDLAEVMRVVTYRCITDSYTFDTYEDYQLENE